LDGCTDKKKGFVGSTISIVRVIYEGVVLQLFEYQQDWCILQRYLKRHDGADIG
jgi:hypothetical protein